MTCLFFGISVGMFVLWPVRRCSRACVADSMPIHLQLWKWPFEDCSFKRRKAARLPGPCALSEADHRDWTRSKSSCKPCIRRGDHRRSPAITEAQKETDIEFFDGTKEACVAGSMPTHLQLRKWLWAYTMAPTSRAFQEEMFEKVREKEPN